MLPIPDEPRLEATGVPNSPVATPPLGEGTGRAGLGAVGHSVEPSPPAVLSYFNARDRAGRVGRPQTLAGMASVVCMAQFLAHGFENLLHYSGNRGTVSAWPDSIAVILNLLTTAIIFGSLALMAATRRRLIASDATSVMVTLMIAVGGSWIQCFTSGAGSRLMKLCSSSAPPWSAWGLGSGG